jgi:serine/threonine-protein kinase
MAQVYLGRMTASAGFNRLVAIKRLHDSLAEDPGFVAMLLDEARLMSRIRHTNVVDILDVVVQDGAFALVLEWVEGAAVSTLWKRARQSSEAIPRPIVLAIVQGVVRGLAAAHEARAEDGTPLGIVHRDISPQNVLVGTDGVARIIDFGVAKAFGKLESTRPGEVRGKFSYMAPEQLMGKPVTPQVDLYAAGVMAWELLTGKRLFKADDARVVCAAVLRGEIPKPSAEASDVPPALDDFVMRATSRDPGDRFLDAREMLAALEPMERASEEEVGAWVRALAADVIESRHKLVQASSAPEAPRSLESLLAELASSSRPSSGPISVPTPPERDAEARAQDPDPTATTLPTSPRKTKNTTWLVAMGACASVALAALAAGAVSVATAKQPVASAAAFVDPATAQPSAVPIDVGEVDPAALPSASAAPHWRPPPRHKPHLPAPSAARDPTDFR